MENKTVLVNGCRINYLASGQIGKRTILFIHGWKSSSAVWKHIFSSELNQNFNLVAVDLLGFGDSDKPYYFDYTIESYAALLRQFILQSGLRPYAIIGHSLGGLIALRYAASFDVRKLILVGAPISKGDAPLVRFYAKHKFLSKIGEKLFKIPGVEYVEFLVRSVFNRPTRNLIQEHGRIAKEASPLASQKSAESIVSFKEMDFREWMNKTNSQILFLRGEKDKFALRSPRHLKVEAIKFTETGHCPMLEAPRLFVAELSKFLQQNANIAY